MSSSIILLKHFRRVYFKLQMKNADTNAGRIVIILAHVKQLREEYASTIQPMDFVLLESNVQIQCSMRMNAAEVIAFTVRRDFSAIRKKRK